MAAHNPVLANALNTTGIKKLRNKRVVLASASPRRSEILRTLVSAPLFYHKYIQYSPSISVVDHLFITSSNLNNGTSFHQGLAPEIVPSTFAENLPLSSFEQIHEYPVATAMHKAVEVYERLVVRTFVVR